MSGVELSPAGGRSIQLRTQKEHHNKRCLSPAQNQSGQGVAAIQHTMMQTNPERVTTLGASHFGKQFRWMIA